MSCWYPNNYRPTASAKCETQLTILRQRPRIRWDDLAGRSRARQPADSSCWGPPRPVSHPAEPEWLLLARATWTRSSRHDCCYRCCSTGDGIQRPPSGTQCGGWGCQVSSLAYPFFLLFVAPLFRVTHTHSTVHKATTTTHARTESLEHWDDDLL